MSSKPSKTPSHENRSFRRSGKGTELIRVDKKLHLHHKGDNGASVISQKDAVPGTQQVPREEHQAAPLVLVLQVLLHVALIWRCNLCCQGPARAQENSPNLVRRKNHHPCASIPPSRPSEMTDQRGSRSFHCQTQPDIGKFSHRNRNNRMLAKREDSLESDRECILCHKRTSFFCKKVRASRSPPMLEGTPRAPRRSTFRASPGASRLDDREL